MPTTNTDRVRGLDLSHHNAVDSFHAIKDAGYAFVILKATQGARTADDTFRGRFTRAKSVGLLTAAYHFLTPNTPACLQVANFLNAVRRAGWGEGDLRLALDVEADTDGSVPSLALATEAVKAIKQATGYYPFFYTGSALYHERYEGIEKMCPLWLARYSSHEPEPRPAIWQYADNGHPDGTSGSVDMDVFYGSLSDLREKHTVKG